MCVCNLWVIRVGFAFAAATNTSAAAEVFVLPDVLTMLKTPQLLLRCLFVIYLGKMEGETIMGEKACIFSRILHTDASAAAL